MHRATHRRSRIHIQMATDQNFDCGKIENDAGLKHMVASNNMMASNTHTASTSAGISL
jgi:hypothetical protein